MRIGRSAGRWKPAPHQRAGKTRACKPAV